MEKRKHKRVAPSAEGWQAKLNDALTGQKLGEVVNLSPGGVMIMASKALEIESLYQVECLATGPNEGHGQFSAGVMVLWRAEANQKGSFWVGLKIIDIDPQSLECMSELGLAMEAGI